MFTPAGTTNVEVTYTAENTLGEEYKLDAADVGTSNTHAVKVISSDDTILSPSDVTVDGNNKLKIAKFKKAGTVKLTLLSTATGESSQITIEVQENAGSPYAVSLGKSTVDFAAGYTTPIYVDMPVVDKYGTAIAAKDIVAGDYTVTLDNGTLATVGVHTTADANQGKLVITPKSGAVKGATGVVTVTVNATGQKASLTLSAKDAAVPTAVVTKKNTSVATNMLTGATQTLSFDVHDQYSNIIGNTANYTVEYSTTDNTVVSVTDPTQQDGLASASAQINALKAGSATVKAQLKKDGVAIAEKSYTINVGANDSSKVTYSIGDIPVLFKNADVDADAGTAAGATAAEVDAVVDAGYGKEFKVTATDASGNVYTVPSSSIVSITTNNAGVAVKQGTDGKYYIVTDTVALGSPAADQKVNVVVTINANDTVKTITKEVTVSKDDRTAVSFAFKNEAASVANVDTAEDVDSLEISSADAYTTAIPNVYTWVKDQFGGYGLSADTVSIIPGKGITGNGNDTVTVNGSLTIADGSSDTIITADNAFRVVGIKGTQSDFINVTVKDAGVANVLAKPQWGADGTGALNAELTKMYDGTYGIFVGAGDSSVDFIPSKITAQVKTDNGFWQDPAANPYQVPVAIAKPALATGEPTKVTVNGTEVALDTVVKDANYSTTPYLIWLKENMAVGTYVYEVTFENGYVASYTVVVKAS
ncbi:hypothetical protein [Cytobacillus firmus]|uniref:S-layer protein n=1 Tax=Cytobacillus firmus DS1 TaxID=1307436 RepID=W7KX90_CYTFI|nr:hypothetical protein [Cytobacillus firmus]EWG12025.1 S-layer protein [Cytobacillus firmus DS1]